jgi:hypothetical protein
MVLFWGSRLQDSGRHTRFPTGAENQCCFQSKGSVLSVRLVLTALKQDKHDSVKFFVSSRANQFNFYLIDCVAHAGRCQVDAGHSSLREV